MSPTVDHVGQELLGSDLDWFAADINGNIGQFSSNGTLAVPSAVKENIQLWENVSDQLLELPERKGSSVRHSSARNWNRWFEAVDSSRVDYYYGASEEWADRGFFAFDCPRELKGDPYFLVCSPHEPLNLEQLAADLKNWIGVLRFPFTFSSRQTIAAEEILRL